MDNELKIGSVVKLKSSDQPGQKFTYGGQSGSGRAMVFWYNAGEIKEALIPIECLQTVE